MADATGQSSAWGRPAGERERQARLTRAVTWADMETVLLSPAFARMAWAHERDIPELERRGWRRALPGTTLMTREPR